MDPQEIDEKTQQALNTPVADPTGVNNEDQEFLELILKLVNEGKINLYSPSSLINEAYYNTLSEESRGKVDMEAVNMLTSIRNIKDLHDAGFTDSFQIQNMVAAVRNTKERLEEDQGDLFII